jgi:carboxypeptidase PM20D1
MAEGSKGMNVIPESAFMISNHRIIPGETVKSVVDGIRKRIGDSDVEIKVLYGMDPSRISVTEGDGWDRINSTVRESFGDVIVSPYLMLACSDSRHFGEISDRVYRFSPMELSKEERGLIHASDERIPLSTVYKVVEFYTRLIGKC